MAANVDSSSNSNTNFSTTDPFSNPYTLQHSDNPTAVLVSPPLNGDNYNTWHRSMRMALRAKNKLGFVDGTITVPNSSVPTYHQWVRVNDMITSWLIHSMVPELATSIIYADTAQAIWTDLQERFSQPNSMKIYEVKKSISDCLQKDLSITTYYTRLKILWDELASYITIPTCSCGAAKAVTELLQQDHAMQFLEGLNDGFSAIRSQILLQEPLPSVNKIYSLMLQEERQRLLVILTPNPTEGSALVASQSSQQKSKPAHVFLNHGKGTNGQKNRPKINCTHCGRDNHTIDKCYKIHGYPPRTNQYSGNHPSKHSHSQPRVFAVASAQQGEPSQGSEPAGVASSTITQEQYDHILTILQRGRNDPLTNFAGMSLSSFLNDTWIIDSGATNHMCSSSEILQSSSPNTSLSTVQMADGSTATITRIGSTSINPSLHLDNIFLIPSFKFNLLSVSQLTKSLNCSVTFFSDHCVFQDLTTKKTIGVGKCWNGLYYLQRSMNFLAGLKPSFDIWHWRLGHPAANRSVSILSIDPGVSFSKKIICDVCPLGKHARNFFPSSNIKTTAPFQLIHCDIWGSFFAPSNTDAHYFLTIVDDFSRCTWVFLMKHKSETQSILKTFISFISTQYATRVGNIQTDGALLISVDELKSIFPVKGIRTDNGTEFLSKELQDFFKIHGIIHQRSCVSTPQQNGVVERKHRHLLDVARTLRFQSNLPLIFWGECILTAAYLINKIPSPVLNEKTPHELLLGSPPTYSHLKVFGCLCYAHNLSPQRHKFDARSKPGIFIGYPFGQKGYKIYDLKSKTIYTSRDVLFYEQIFPYRNYHDHPSSQPVLPLPISEIHNDLHVPSSENHSPCNSRIEISNSQDHPVRYRRPPRYLNDYICNTTITAHDPPPMSSSGKGTITL